MSETPEPMASPSPRPLPGPAEAETPGPARTEPSGGSAETETSGSPMAETSGLATTVTPSPAEGETAQTPQAASAPGEAAVAAPDAGTEEVGAETMAALPEDAEAARLRRAKARLVFDDPLYGRGGDDSDRGWGDRPVSRGGSAADLARFLDEKPPHHI